MRRQSEEAVRDGVEDCWAFPGPPPPVVTSAASSTASSMSWGEMVKCQPTRSCDCSI